MEFLSSTYFDEFITVIVLQLIAVASPGPDFAIVVQNSLVHSRRIGVFTAIGIAFGVIFHVALALFGIGLIISQSKWIFNIVRLMACGYLLFLAYKSFKAGEKGSTSKNKDFKPIKQITKQEAFYTGAVTNILNPKAILFFLSVFTVVVSPSTPITILTAYGLVIFFITLLWFLFIAISFSNAKVHSWFENIAHWIHRVMGFIFVLLAFKLFYEIVIC